MPGPERACRLLRSQILQTANRGRPTARPGRLRMEWPAPFRAAGGIG